MLYIYKYTHVHTHTYTHTWLFQKKLRLFPTDSDLGFLLSFVFRDSSFKVKLIYTDDGLISRLIWFTYQSSCLSTERFHPSVFHISQRVAVDWRESFLYAVLCILCSCYSVIIANFCQLLLGFRFVIQEAIVLDRIIQ